MPYLPADVTLWIASDGIGIDDLQNTYGADSRIKWLGRISEEDKLNRLARCTVFCAPSLRGESFGIVLLEAMAAGAPLVASNISGYNNVASNDVNALLVEPGNPVELANPSCGHVMNLVYDSRWLRVAMSAQLIFDATISGAVPFHLSTTVK